MLRVFIIAIKILWSYFVAFLVFQGINREKQSENSVGRRQISTTQHQTNVQMTVLGSDRLCGRKVARN